MKKLTYYIFRTYLAILKITPFFLLYGFSFIMYFFMYHVFRYRRTVVYGNLRKSFPEKSEPEIREISKRFYKHLGEIFVEGVKGYSMSEKSFKKRYRIIGAEIAKKYLDQERTVIALASHYGNWEWGIETVAKFFNHKVIALYKPINNKYIDTYLKEKRIKGGMYLVPMYETRLTFEEAKDNPALIIMAADQSPLNLKKTVWVNFFNQDTPCNYGPEYYSVHYNLPLVYFDVQKVKKGYYTLTIREMMENPSGTEPGEVTGLYMRTLENIITEKPEYWLWSHKRWKHKRKNENEEG
jgi:KDO2-lipid IV(A) lauroyltransferase